MSGGAVLRFLLPKCKPAASMPWKVPRRRPVDTRTGSPQWDLLPQGRAVHFSALLLAGHNKWSKVKDIKIPKDAARARIITKFSMLIKVAVKEGGSNPEFNVALAQLIEQCRNKNIPKATIEAAIHGAEKSKAASHHFYEARGPGGCLLLIEVFTDNNTRSHQEIKHLLLKNGAVLCVGALNNFDRKGVVVASRDGVSAERALELAIEAGAEDVHETEDEEQRSLLQFICDLSSTKGVRTALEAFGVHTLSTGMEYISHTPTPLPQNQLDASATLLEVLNNYPDVVRVWDNICALE
ncbi:translational activator of cytochrome c oxidase 1 [Electrophorus electricus]|uniref:Translational activator of cytochrome c oxidase 1 n=2 Tax=Electrophorus TaxID=8004 RepID=A0A4W4HEF1_ELEEL|nr:translational activator of cytochrome c oxidase 1 [Electrophorus electricus]XP_026864965.1 translational activator of cytochrome c oxidase 1 [Electrophorus electricus]